MNEKNYFENLLILKNENDELKSKNKKLNFYYQVYKNLIAKFLLNENSYDIKHFLEEYPKTLGTGVNLAELVQDYNGRDLFIQCVRQEIPLEDIQDILEIAFSSHPEAEVLYQKAIKKEEEEANEN